MSKWHGSERINQDQKTDRALSSRWSSQLTKLATTVLIAALVFSPLSIPSPRATQALAADDLLTDLAEEGKAPSSTKDDANSLSDLEKEIQGPSGKTEAPNATTEDALLQSETAADKSEAKNATDTKSPAQAPSEDVDLGDVTAEASAGKEKPAGAEQTKSTVAENQVAASGEVSQEKNSITNVDFKMDGPTSRIIIHSRNTLQYRVVQTPGTKQLVYYFDNTEIAERLQRAFDTSEFPSPVALFTLLQMPQNNPPLTKLIVQMRENKEPVLVPSKNSLSIDFPAPDHKSEPKIIIGDNEGNGPHEGSAYSASRTFTNKNLKLLEVKNSDVQDVLRMLAKTSGYNIIVGDDVNGKVGTLSLENVPWDQAFALVLQSKKLGYVRQGNIIRVATLGSLKSEKDDELANEQARIRVEPLRTVLIPVSYATAAGIVVQAKSFLTNRGSATVDARTNTIILKDIDSSVSKIQKLVAALDTQPPSVSISAKIMELETSFTRSIGFSSLTFDENTAGLEFKNTTSFTGGGASTTVISAPRFASLLNVFQLGELDQKARTLANPSVSVVANTHATMTQSITLYVVTSAAAGAGFIPTPTIQSISASLTLNVQPIVANDGSISLDVSVRNEVPSGNQPPISVNSRAVQTNILMENGDTAVLGGIFQNTVTEGKQGIPFLMQIPILGFFFSDNTINSDRTETFIFLTAKILNPEEAFKRSF